MVDAGVSLLQQLRDGRTRVEVEAETDGLVIEVLTRRPPKWEQRLLKKRCEQWALRQPECEVILVRTKHGEFDAALVAAAAARTLGPGVHVCRRLDPDPTRTSTALQQQAYTLRREIHEIDDEAPLPAFDAPNLLDDLRALLGRLQRRAVSTAWARLAHVDTLRLVLDFLVDTRESALPKTIVLNLDYDRAWGWGFGYGAGSWGTERVRTRSPGPALAECARTCKLFAQAVRTWVQARAEWQLQLAVTQLFKCDPSKTMLVQTLPAMAAFVDDPRLQPRQYTHSVYRRLCTSYPLDVLRKQIGPLLGTQAALKAVLHPNPKPKPTLKRQAAEQSQRPVFKKQRSFW
jgi:hypothetical protein